jgi:hypothetical protein
MRVEVAKCPALIVGARCGRIQTVGDVDFIMHVIRGVDSVAVDLRFIRVNTGFEQLNEWPKLTVVGPERDIYTCSSYTPA